MKDKDIQILSKILTYIDDIALFSSGMGSESFMQDKKTTSACAFGIMQIGELAKELSDDIQNQNPNLPWNGIRGMRNRIAHDYKNVDYTILWDTVQTSLPELKDQLTELLKTL